MKQVKLSDAFTHENIIRALKESTEDQRKILQGESLDFVGLLKKWTFSLKSKK